ncbi:AAA family ATPase [Flavobacterium sp. N3904]|uniref:AAA family ATPase n=1 Tax=Flavobacterium sp. N3904 TaxID=2986835 RepID=UPI0022257B66|nr:AAA family ATPase [Flavobacterium sp. N3904]
MIKDISIYNYKSIRKIDNLPLNNINILIGSNGVGKSNFISFLTLLKEIANRNLQEYVADKGGANNIIHFGVKKSTFLAGHIIFHNNNAYEFALKPNDEDTFYFSNEVAAFFSNGWHKYGMKNYGYKESNLNQLSQEHKDKRGYGGIPEYVRMALSTFEIYHFHDTSSKSPIKQNCDIHDNRFLRKDGSNLAAFLFLLKMQNPKSLALIENVIKQIAPFFDTFILEPMRLNTEKIRLEWREKGSDEYFNAHHFSDGTIRMIALTTLLLQPDPPKTIIIDEPELGLHPAAINLLANLIKRTSKKNQVIISTQSVTLINQFSIDDIIIVERESKNTTFKRLSPEQIETWLEDYSLGEAWEKNILGARP